MNMRGIIIDPGKAPEICKLPNDSQGLERWLGGPVHMRPFGKYPAALLHTATAEQDLPNRHYLERWYYGRLIIAGYKNCRLMPLPQDLAEQLAEHFTPVEVARL